VFNIGTSAFCFTFKHYFKKHSRNYHGCVNGNTSSINDGEKRQSIGTCSSEESTAMKRLSMKKTGGDDISRDAIKTSSISAFIVSAILEASDHIDLGMNKNDHLIS
jgi:hypothetical protein